MKPNRRLEDDATVRARRAFARAPQPERCAQLRGGTAD